MRYVSPSLCLVLIPLIAVFPLWGEAQPVDATVQSELHIEVIDPGNGFATADTKTDRGLSARVTDSDGRPVKDAAVTFHLPEDGPSGKFADGSIALVGYTNDLGEVSTSAITWNRAAGTAPIRITAAKGTLHSGVLLEEKLIDAGTSRASSGAEKPVAELASPASIPHVEVTIPDLKKALNTSASGADAPAPVSVTSASPGAAPSHSKTKWIILAAVVAGAGAGLALTSKGKASTGSAQASQISIGTPSISVGHP
jgi:hypothetical protein